MNVLPTRRPPVHAESGIMGCLIYALNGVAQGSKHFSSGDASSQVVLGSSMDSFNGNDGSHPPTNPDVSSSNRFGAKNPRGDTEDGSLPCTAELPLDSDVTNCPARDEVLENDTRLLLSQLFREFTGLCSVRWSESKAQETMRRAVENILDKHRYTYNGMINKLSLDDRGDDVSFVSSVARSLFSDGTTNWGRIVSLVAFGASVCKHLKDQGRENCVDLVSQEITAYLVSEQRDWLVKNNSWDGFVERFHVADPDSTLRNPLMAFAGLIGLGATLAMLAR